MTPGLSDQFGPVVLTFTSRSERRKKKSQLRDPRKSDNANQVGVPIKKSVDREDRRHGNEIVKKEVTLGEFRRIW